MTKIHKTKIRKATVADVPAIAELINLHAQKGIMLPRPISRIYDNLRDYQVIEEDGRIAACSSLHITWSDLAEPTRTSTNAFRLTSWASAIRAPYLAWMRHPSSSRTKKEM